MVQTLAQRVAAIDRARFRGRARELALLEGLLDDDHSGHVVLLHAPGGMGKSALLRELARRASDRGLTPRLLDGRDVAPVPGEIDRLLDGVHADERPLVIFDSYERMSGADGWLRQRLVPSLPERAVVVLAGRRPPAEGWLRDGWEHVAVELELGPLGAEEAREMLAAYGVAASDEVLRWARGWPLALSLAATAGAGAAPAERDADLLSAVVARFARTEVDEDRFELVAVAALARSCDARLLRAVLPGVDAEEAIRWLRGLTFAETVGAGVALHDLVRRAVRAQLEGADPERARELRRRLADHVHDRAIAGEPRMLIDLTELIDDPRLRWGLGAEGSVEYRVDAVRPGDVEALEPWYAARPRWWRDVVAFLTEAPNRVVIARDVRDRLAGISIAVTLADPPGITGEDAVLGPWLEDARGRAPGGDALLWHDATDLVRNADPASPVISLMNTAVILGCGIPNVRYSYIPVDPSNPAALQFSHSVGGRSLPELATEVDGHPLECHLIDHGAGGMLGQLREVLYAELRLPAGAARASAPLADAVRDALRNLHRPTALARSPLATGTTAAERAASVRELLTGAVEGAFGDTPEERLLRTVIERGYLDPGSKHELVAEQLNLSRSAYFRRLREGCEHLAAWLAER